MKMHLRAVAIAALFNVTAFAHAQAWPEKPVRIIISNSPGGSPDVLMRVIAERLSRVFGQSFTIDNRPGGQSVIGAEMAAKAAPDGYTFYLGASSAIVMNRFLVGKLPYDPDRDFAYVANIIDSAPFVVAVHPSVPARTMPELIRYAKASLEKVAYGIAIGTSDTLAQWLNRETGVDIPIVRYKENRQAVADALAGRIPILLISYPSINAHVDSGKLRIIAVSSGKRFPGLEDVPAIAEDYPGLVVGGWWALVAPVRTPDAIVQRVNREMDKILKDPGFVQRVRSFGFTTSEAMTPVQLAERARADVTLWIRVSKELGLKPQ